MWSAQPELRVPPDKANGAALSALEIEGTNGAAPSTPKSEDTNESTNGAAPSALECAGATKGTNHAAPSALQREGEGTNDAAPSALESEDTEYPPERPVRSTQSTPAVPPYKANGETAGMSEPSVLGAQPELKVPADKANTAALRAGGAEPPASTTHFTRRPRPVSPRNRHPPGC